MVFGGGFGLVSQPSHGESKILGGFWLSTYLLL
jgi:hypothetical protein